MVANEQSEISVGDQSENLAKQLAIIEDRQVVFRKDRASFNGSGSAKKPQTKEQLEKDTLEA
jgi:hypothetical protein